ncbi:Inositolphosphorylceramide synthase subunit Kei1-domain-containing protein [Lineolata rhizophorae]|uniref:Inositolphosphorylceramide synthase subunit Kei1-domain-containing protein n=1 Tax=Lineolata rhizophorae TaxID=578093 RepID=A0A6A6P5N6_9PEZI|nr:Inositolphosphorylceramide synthase subunit Kei1-domain-containing protein [Lineolata rhizophorae]
MARSTLFSIPRPQTFLYLMSLRTGTELITLTILINKISGLYGILALFTGYELSNLQLSMYVYSLVVLVLTVYLAPHIRRQSPLQCLALAYLYAIDSAVNALYTAAFGFAWFHVLAEHAATSQQQGQPAPAGSPGSTMDDTAGFTSPKYNVSDVHVVAEPAAGVLPAQDAVALGAGSASGPAGIGSNIFFQSGSFASLGIIVALWALRGYFVLVVLAYARSVLRSHILQCATAAAAGDYAPYAAASATTAGELAENPFAEGKDEGRGWRGRLGRAMLAVGTEYWLGGDDEAQWMRGMGGKFRRSVEDPGRPLTPAPPAAPGTTERERRRRSGTGPPPPPPPMPQFVELNEVR